jgi:protein-disulfide isomerase
MKVRFLRAAKTLARLFIVVIAINFKVSLASSNEISLGITEAPVTIIEHGSLTCDYCISFHQKVLPEIKSHYIDKGKVRFIYRHFPTGDAAQLT